MRGVHVYDDEAARVLREDEDVVDLAEGVAERVFCLVVIDGRGSVVLLPSPHGGGAGDGVC